MLSIFDQHFYVIPRLYLSCILIAERVYSRKEREEKKEEDEKDNSSETRGKKEKTGQTGEKREIKR